MGVKSSSNITSTPLLKDEQMKAKQNKTYVTSVTSGQ